VSGPTAFAGLVTAFLRDEHEASPVAASHLGLTEYDERADDLSESAFVRRTRASAEWLARFEAVADAGLDASARIDRDLLVAVLRGRAIMADWQMWRRQPDVYLGPGLGGVFTLFLHRLRPEAELARAATARLRAVPGQVADGMRNLVPELAPRVYVQRALGQARAGARYARELVAAELADPAQRAAVAEAGATAAAAYEDFAAFLERLAPRAEGAWAIGETRYSRLLRERELLDADARALRERGWAEYERLDAVLRQHARVLAGHEDWRAALVEVNAAHPETPEAMRAAYALWTERARGFLAERGLVTLPDGEACRVEPSPVFQRPVLAVASYQGPPRFSASMTGHFFVPFPPDGASADEIRQRLMDNSLGSIPTTAVHEAYPGHHWHLTMLKANPRPVRVTFTTPYFNEGWALYAERVMHEHGFFTDPRQVMCHHEATIFRAARIVVDTSLHTGEMTVDDAVRFMTERTSLTGPTARAEVARYCSWPTQAASYLTGCLEILPIRDRYLAGRGDGIAALRRFHDGLVSTGGLPPALAERALREEAT
jgi:uncharacterized protein (DUF885 family)